MLDAQGLLHQVTTWRQPNVCRPETTFNACYNEIMDIALDRVHFGKPLADLVTLHVVLGRGLAPVCDAAALGQSTHLI